MWLARSARLLAASGVGMQSFLHRRETEPYIDDREPELDAASQPYAAAVARRQRSPEQYLHVKVSAQGRVATLTLDVQERAALMGEYPLKLNSSDFGVEHEIYDALNRIMFEYPSTETVVLASASSAIFSAGANISMLQKEKPSYLTAFVRYANVTRCALEELTRRTGIGTVAALSGSAAGAGYELALAAERIVLVDDGHSAVSLPEVPLLGVIPASGGLTRIIDKRKVRRDFADIFCTRQEGIRGKRALEWKLVDALARPSSFDQEVNRLVTDRMRGSKEPAGVTRGIAWPPLRPVVEGDQVRYRNVTLAIDAGKRTAEVTIHAPESGALNKFEDILARGEAFYYIAMFRELEDALLRLELDHPQIGLVVFRLIGSFEPLVRYDRILESHREHRVVQALSTLISTVLKRIDHSPKSYFTLLYEDDYPAGTALEIALASDRVYARPGGRLQLSPANWGMFAMANGLSRLFTRCAGDQDRVAGLCDQQTAIDVEDACSAGLVTEVVDSLDWDTDVRLAVEERTHFSPEALCGMEANLRLWGPETLETKIFGRLAAWQTFIFARENALGAQGAIRSYGGPHRPVFRWDRP
jgi:benzoyl-CoA-dihydrodiol lyase